MKKTIPSEQKVPFGLMKRLNACAEFKMSQVPKILRTCVPLNNSPLASRSKGYYNTVNGTIRSVIERKELKP